MEKCLPICVEAIRAAEMRQGCTNHSYYAEILLKQLIPIIQKAVYDTPITIKGGKCPDCRNGKRYCKHANFNSITCYTCEGTGQISGEAKTIGEIIEEYTDGKTDG